MKLLIISPWSSDWSLGEGKGGAGAFKVTQRLLERGHQIYYVCPDELSAQAGLSHSSPKKEGNIFFYRIKDPFQSASLRRRLSKSKFRIITFLIIGYLRVKEWSLFIIRAWRVSRKIIKKYSIDVVIGYSPFGSIVSSLLGRVFKLPSLGEFFGIHDFYLKFSSIKYKVKDFEIHLAFRFPPSKMIIHNDGTFGDLVAHHYQIPKHQFVFWLNGVDFSWANSPKSKQCLREELALPKEVKIVISVSRLEEYKKVDRIIRAIPKVIAKFKEVVFLIIGSGSSKKELQQLVKNLRVENYVIFTGAVLQEEVKYYLKASDLFISLSDVTNRVNPLQEAFVCGLPAIVLNTGSVKEVVKDGENGRVIEEENLPELPVVILELLLDDEKRKRFGENAQKFALQNFISWEERVSKEVELIEGLKALSAEEKSILYHKAYRNH
jgi:glycosyltransferase involved in cell wall biosynthesis